MSRYLASGSIAAAANKTAGILGASVNVRPKLTYLNLSLDGAPTSDQGIIVNLQRASALGTTTPVTPTKTDPADQAAVATFGSNASAEPTYSGSVMNFSMNTRTTFQWAAYDQESAIVVPASANNGLGAQMTALGGAAGNFIATMGWRE